MNDFPTLPLPNANEQEQPTAPQLSIAQLEQNWQDLLRFHHKTDPKQLLPSWLFAQISKQLKQLQNDPLLSDMQLQGFHRTLEQLRVYLHQFQIFSVNREILRTVQKAQRKKRPTALAKQISSTKNQLNYAAAKAYEQRLLKAFTRAAHWQGDISHTVSQFDYYVRQIQQKQEAEKTKSPQPIAEMDLFSTHREGIEKVVQQTAPNDTFNATTTYVNNLISAVPRLEPERMEQIKQGYFFLQNQVMHNYIRRRPHRLTEPLQVLLQSLKSGHRLRINDALQNLKKYIKPTIIDEPNNFSTAPERLIRILGHAEPLSTVVIQVNGKEPVQLRADIVGDFRLDDITLKFGKNIITCYSAEYLFLDNVPLILHIHFEESYPFIGRIDPLTQKPFQKTELNMIMKCQICGNFQYDFSIEENDGYCTLLDCDGSEFLNHDKPRFWTF